jgi:hypothetical protein
MHKVGGGCHCGNIRIEAGLTRPPDSYQPRACDCDFCTKHRAAYLSDPQGSLLIRVRDEQQCGRYALGSGQAELLFCRNCGVLVSPLYRDGGRIYGAVNVNVVDAAAAFGQPLRVSPQQLSAGDKVKRWKEFWFSDVTLLVEP